MTERHARSNGALSGGPVEVIWDEIVADMVARDQGNNDTFIIDGRVYLEPHGRGERRWRLIVVADHVIRAERAMFDDDRSPEVAGARSAPPVGKCRFETIAFVLAVGLLFPVFSATPVLGADAAKVKAAIQRTESGAKQAGDGIAETAKGVGGTVVEGAKVAGEKLTESAQAAEPEVKSAWAQARDSATAFGQSVKAFFARLFSR